MNATPEMMAANTAPATAPARNNIVMDCQIDKVFYGDFLASLARLQLSAWSLLLGPAALFLVVRLAAGYAWTGEA